eukprot:Tamp_11233.p1 GENE.Tamp_11233~~Tamp_11233.p1  ORF type:complete len:518 (-),score=67.71 Tamp_11233:387-1841(-)
MPPLRLLGLAITLGLVQLQTTSAFHPLQPIHHTGHSPQRLSERNARRARAIDIGPRMLTRRAATVPLSDLSVRWQAPDAAGGFGAVYFGKLKTRIQNEQPMDVVVKVAFKDSFAERLLENELHFNRLLARNVPAHHGRRWAKIIGTCRGMNTANIPHFPDEVSSARVLVFEREKGATLEEYLTSKLPSIGDALHMHEPSLGAREPGQSLRFRLFAKVLGELMCCLLQLHRAGLIHRDIKPENLLLVSHERTCPLKIIDFGSACDMGAPLQKGLRDETVDPLYCPPELRVDRQNPCSFDVFCAAVTCMRVLMPSIGKDVTLLRHIMTHELPQHGYNLLAWCRWRDAKGPEEMLTAECRELLSPQNLWAAHILSGMLSHDPQARPSPTQVLENLGPLWQAQLRSVEMLSGSPHLKSVDKLCEGLCGRLARQLRQDPMSVLTLVLELVAHHLLPPVSKAIAVLTTGTTRFCAGVSQGIGMTKRLLKV